MDGWKEGWVWNTGGMILTEKTQVPSQSKLSQCHFVNHKSHMDWPGFELRCPWWEVSN